MQALGKLLIDSLLIPLIEKGITLLFKYFKEQKQINDKLKKAKKAVEKVKDARTKKEINDSINKLP